MPFGSVPVVDVAVAVDGVVDPDAVNAVVDTVLELHLELSAPMALCAPWCG